MTASSSLDDHDQAFNGRLVRESIDQADIRGCWCAKDVNLRQYIEADLGEVKTVTGEIELDFHKFLTSLLYITRCHEIIFAILKKWPNLLNAIPKMSNVLWISIRV